METVTMLWIALIALGCANLAYLAVNLLRRRAVAHKGLLKMAAALQTWGLKTIPDILTSIAVQDWIQVEKDVEFWVRVFEGDPNAAIKELDAVLKNVLAAHGLIAVPAPTEAPASSPNLNVIG